MKKNIGLSLLTGILLALAFPPFKTGVIAFGALIPFFVLLEDKSGASAFRWGYITGLSIALFTLSWIAWATVAGLIGVLLVWPLYMSLFALIFSFLRQRLSFYAYLAAPALWTCIEYLQSLSELAFPWNHLGYAQSYSLPFIQFAEYTSVYGVSFWVVLINVLFFFAFRLRRQRWPATFASVLAVTVWLLPLPFGVQKMQQQNSESIRMTLVQANLDPNIKWSPNLYEENFTAYEKLTHQALPQQPDLIVWPETAVPFYLRSEPGYLMRVHRFMDSCNVSLLTGSLDYQYLDDGSYVYFNSALFLEPHRNGLQYHHKMKLVPFSERVPYSGFFIFRAMKSLFWNMGLGDYALGKEIRLFDGRFSRQTEQSIVEYRTGAAVCYESVFSDHVRRYVKNGAQFLVIITNDAWFGKTQAPFQHNQIAVFRAIENRRDIARCANTGISCFIDRCGRIRQATSLYSQAVITDEVKLSTELTFFTRHGHVFVAATALVALAALSAALFTSKVKQ